MSLIAGETAPSLIAQSLTVPDYVLDTAAGRYLIVAFVPAARASTALTVFEGRMPPTGKAHAHGFLIVTGADPEQQSRRNTPDVTHLFDPDATNAADWGLADGDERWFLIDPAMQIMGSVGAEHAAALVSGLAELPPPSRHGGFEAFPPVLITPRIFEPPFCQALIAHYQQIGGRPSGVMADADQGSEHVLDTRFKSRSDVVIHDPALQAEINQRIDRRLRRQIEKAFGFQAAHLERYLVAGYDSRSGGHFRSHRDNTTRATAHRRFALTINLNDDYDGGDLRFPEFGDRTWRPPVGGACVFSCSLLHEVVPVTRGVRYAFLPFLHDEAAEKLREENLKHLDPAVLG